MAKSDTQYEVDNMVKNIKYISTSKELPQHSKDFGYILTIKETLRNIEEYSRRNI